MKFMVTRTDGGAPVQMADRRSDAQPCAGAKVETRTGMYRWRNKDGAGEEERKFSAWTLEVSTLEELLELAGKGSPVILFPGAAYEKREGFPEPHLEIYNGYRE